MEVTDRDNKYFERAVLFLRTDCTLSSSALEDEAKQYIAAAQSLAENGKKHPDVAGALLRCAAASAIILAAALTVYLVVLAENLLA